MVSKARVLDKKVETINEIKTYVDNASTIIVVNFKKINANKMNVLRRELKEKNAFLKIYKNTLVSLATKNKYPLFSEGLTFNNAFVFSNDTGLDCLRILKKFKDENKSLEISKGIFNYEEKCKEDLNILASLPNKEGLLSMVISSLQWKMKILLFTLKEVSLKSKA